MINNRFKGNVNVIKIKSIYSDEVTEFIITIDNPKIVLSH